MKSGRLGPLFPRPASHQLAVCLTRPLIEEAAHDPKYGALERERHEQLRPRNLAMLGIGRLLVVDSAPEELEDLLAHRTRGDSANNADRNEKNLAHTLPPCSTSAVLSLRVSRGGNGTRSAGCPAARNTITPPPSAVPGVDVDPLFAHFV